MITFSQLITRAADIEGINTSTDSQGLTNIKQDLNQGLRLFMNASRRYWTRKEVTADVVASQQYYTFPEDMVRVTEVRANTGNGGYNWPLIQIDSEDMWNRYNIIPSSTVIMPQFFFIRGRNEIGLYPIPSIAVTGGLIVSYESRQPDMVNADTTGTTVTVTEGSVSVTSPSVAFSTNMVGMWFSTSNGTDGNWYQIVAATTSVLTLENYYQGTSGSAVACTIATVPPIPEDYHLGLVYYAAYNYFLKRNENANAIQYKGLYEDLLQQYRETYAAKTTGVVQKSLSDNIFNIFWLPPGTITSS